MLPRRGIACSVEVRQTDMVSTSIDSVDNGVGGALELVIEPARDKPPDKLRGRVSAIERKVSVVPLDALIGKPAVNALDDVGPLAQRAHDGLGVLRQTPLRRSEGFGDAKALKLFHTADHGGASVRFRSSVDAGSKINNPIIPRSLTGKANSRGGAGSLRRGARRARSSSARLARRRAKCLCGDNGTVIVRGPAGECKDAAWCERDDASLGRGGEEGKGERTEDKRGPVDSMFLNDAPEANPVLDAVLEPCELDASKLAHGASPHCRGMGRTGRARSPRREYRGRAGRS